MQKVYLVGSSPEAVFVDEDGTEYQAGETVEVSNDKAKQLTELGYVRFEKGEAPKTEGAKLVRRDTVEGDVRYVDSSGDTVTGAESGTAALTHTGNTPPTGPVTTGAAAATTTKGGE